MSPSPLANTLIPDSSLANPYQRDVIENLKRKNTSDASQPQNTDSTRSRPHLQRSYPLSQIPSDLLSMIPLSNNPMATVAHHLKAQLPTTHQVTRDNQQEAVEEETYYNCLDNFAESNLMDKAGLDGMSSHKPSLKSSGSQRGSESHLPTQDDMVQDGQENIQDEESEESEDEDSYDSSECSTGSSSTVSWIEWFVSLPGHEFLTMVPEEFIEDDFNLCGLSSVIPMYSDALDCILDIDPAEVYDPSQLAAIEDSAEKLYALIHQRFILTKQGLSAMVDKYQAGDFGVCPRTLCGSPSVVPTSFSDSLDHETIKVYCPRCNDVYYPKDTRVQKLDGAFFGMTFAHLFYLTYPELVPPMKAIMSENGKHVPVTHQTVEDSDDDNEIVMGSYRLYTPRIFGFRVNERSAAGPRMSWLRWREGACEPHKLTSSLTKGLDVEEGSGMHFPPERK